MSEARNPGAARPTAASEALTEDFPAAGPTAEDHPSWQIGGPFAAGDLVGERYRILRLVGQGGMGVVFEAHDLELGERLALKVVRPEVAAQAQTLDRFRREISLARKVTHPNVCRIYDVGHHQGQNGEEITFLTMELLTGETLAKRLARQGPLGEEEGLSIGCQIAAGLSSAHDAGVLHRDFKSSNVILAPAPWGTRAVITDFGLSRTWAPVDEEAPGMKLTGTGQLMGTPAYFAPEQLEGGELTPATDIYAMGIVIYEMVTGSLPFTGSTPFLTALKRLRDAPTDPRTHSPGLDRRWVEVIDGCLQRDPGSRFAHARDILGILGTEHLSEGATTGLTLPVIRRATPGRRLRLPLLITALVLLALVAGAIFHARIDAGRTAAKPLYVAILEPEVDPGPGSLDVGFIASDLQVAVLRGLLTLDGLKPIDPGDVEDLEGGPQEVARALAADELVAARVAGMPAEWRIELRRIRGDDGSVIWVETLRAPTGEARLLAAAVAASLRRGFPDQPPRPGVESQEVRAQDYAAFLDLKRTVESPPADVDWGLVMEQLARLRAGSPRFLDTYLLEARMARFHYQVTYEAEYLERGFELIASARRLAPQDPRTLFWEVQLALAAEELERAERVLDELEQLAPGDVGILTARADLAERRGRPSEALRLHQRAYERRPDVLRLYDLADIEIRLGRVENARTHLEEAIALGYSYARSKLAELELEKGDLETAATLYRELVERSPEDAIPRSNLGLTQLFLGHWAEAAKNFQRAYELTPEDPTSLLNLADCQLFLGRTAVATRLYGDTLELIARGELERYWEYLLFRAQALTHLGRTQEALTDVHRALQLSGESAQASYQAALVFALVGERSSALVNAKRALVLGLSPRWFSLPWFDALRSDPEFQALLDAAG